MAPACAHNQSDFNSSISGQKIQLRGDEVLHVAGLVSSQKK